MKSRIHSLFLSALFMVGGPVLADEQQGGLVENVVVRNRLYEAKGRLEVSPSAAFTVVEQLTSHINFNLGLAYNLSETFAIEARGGYAVSRHTGLASQVAQRLLATPVSQQTMTAEMSNLWEMKGNGLIGARWAPIYGKISLMAELPVHFQAYLGAGAGAGNFERASLVFCRGLDADGQCVQTRRDAKVSWLGSAAAGVRFFTHQGGALKAEVRNYLFPDSYRIDVNRQSIQNGTDTGRDAPNPGLSHMVLVDVGYTFFF